jgi:DNA-binding MarR family transcriptional regulator
VALREEIGQRRPFRTMEEEALLNILRTADRLSLTIQKKLRPYGITMTQYNVLRILRGAGPEGLTCSIIGNLMVAHDPDITRLLGRLEKLKLVRRRRNKKDRRQVCTQISEKGLERLAELDELVDQTNREILGHLSEESLQQMIHLMEQAREHATGD